jgi:hypothetical protein
MGAEHSRGTACTSPGEARHTETMKGYDPLSVISGSLSGKFRRRAPRAVQASVCLAALFQRAKKQIDKTNLPQDDRKGIIHVQTAPIPRRPTSAFQHLRSFPSYQDYSQVG